jgi:hypothetical protein
MTGEEHDRRDELKTQIKDLQTKIDDQQTKAQQNELKAQLGKNVSEMVKSDRLVESYNEKAKRSQSYQADLSQYDAKQHKTIQNAIDSGILNNTNRTHEFVDLIAKVSADKGVPFNFTDNAKLKESGFSINGKTVNGYVTKDGVTLNINSSKALNTVVGHEITHILEGTEFYNTLQTTLFEYAKSKGDYQGRYDALTELYKDIADADVNAELTADLVGDYLFTDSDFINNLSTKNRNIFEKIYDEIKYLCKVATAGSKEARELEKVKKAFEDAYRADSKTEGDTKSVIKNCEMAGNIIRYSGYGWGQQRHNTHTPAHIKGWSYENTAENYSIHDNYFGPAAYRMLHLVALKAESCPKMWNNTYVQKLGNPLGQYGANELQEPPVIAFSENAEIDLQNHFGDKDAKVYYFI